MTLGEFNDAYQSGDEAAYFLVSVLDELKNGRKKHPGNNLNFTALTVQLGHVAEALLNESSAIVYHNLIRLAAVSTRVAVDGDTSFSEFREDAELDQIP
jgi:hypothetical protein